VNLSEANEVSRFKLNGTFQAAVGKGASQQIITVYTEPVIKRSEFFRAARSAQWLADSTKPVDCEDDDPDVFMAYLNCVYFGIDALKAECADQDGFEDHVYPEYESEQETASNDSGDSSAGDWPAQDQTEQDLPDPVPDFDEKTMNFRDHPGYGNYMKPKMPPDAFTMSEGDCLKYGPDEDEKETPYVLACYDHTFHLAQVYLQADKLRDYETANVIMDEFIEFILEKGIHMPNEEVVNLVYESTAHGNPLRKLLRDYYVHAGDELHYLAVRHTDMPCEFYRDCFVETARLKIKNWAPGPLKTGDVFSVYPWERIKYDKCHYNLHTNTDGFHPRCGPPRSRQFETKADLYRG
jgi:hypothetical protein